MLKSLSGRDQLISDDVLKVMDTPTILNRMTVLLLQAREQNVRYKLMMSELQQA